jgi:hypothetical protein
MTISIHTLQDIVVAIIATVGISVAVSLALTAADALRQRAQARGAKPRRGGAVSAVHPPEADAGRELVLR